jgi:hypothetical protein
MKNHSKIILLSLVTILAVSCQDNFLDRKMDSNYIPDEVFTEYNTMRDFGTGIYSYLPNGYNDIDGSMLAAACDEAHHANENSSIHNYASGAWGPTSNPDDKWSYYYTAIRKVNLFLEGSKDFATTLAKRDTISLPSINNYIDQYDNIAKLRLEARFLRAFFYFELVKRYGGVPVISKTLGLNDNFDLERNTADSCFNYIISECLAVSNELPYTWYNYGIPVGSRVGVGECAGISGAAGQSKIGRITKGTAYALAMRASLYAASPLFNTANDIQKWYRAANIGKAYFELPTKQRGLLKNNYMSMYVPAYSTAGYTKDEVIFEKRWGLNNSFEKANYPIGFQSGGTNTICPTQNLVNAFGMGQATQVYNATNPYLNRDPRLDSVIIKNGVAFSSGISNNRNIDSYVGGVDGIGKFRATTTGYYMRKYVNTGLDLLKGQTSWHSWVLFGMNEMYLNYAEALMHACATPNNTTAGDGKVHPKSALALVNEIRNKLKISSRFNLYSYPTSINKADFEKALIKERQIELAFEGHRFFDIRRLRLMDDPAQREAILTIKAMKIVKNTDGSFSYDQNYVVEHREWDDKMYLYPIPNSEIMRSNGKLAQNTGW